MLQKVKSFLSSECGAVTVDWVVLTAAIVGLVIAAFSGMSDAGVSGDEADAIELTLLGTGLLIVSLHS